MTYNPQNPNGSATSANSAPVVIASDQTLLVSNENNTFKDDFPGSALDTTNNWAVNQAGGTATTYSVASSILTLNAQTTANDWIAITSKTGFTVPFRVQVTLQASQRIANNNLYVEVVNAAGAAVGVLGSLVANTEVTQAAYLFNGVTATTGAVVAQNQGVKSTADTNATIATTANFSVYEMECRGDIVDYATRTTDVASAGSLNTQMRSRTALTGGEVYYIQIRSVNGASNPATNTLYKIENVIVQDATKTVVEIAGGRGNSSLDKAIPTAPVSLPTLPLVTTVTTLTTLTNITNWGNVLDNGAFVDGTTRLMPGGFILDEVAGTALSENDAAAARIDSKRAQINVLEDETTRGQRAGVTTTKALKVEPALYPTATALNTYSVRITTNATTTPTSSTAYISSLAITTETVGTTSTVIVRDKQGTPLVLVPAITTVATALTVYNFQTPIKMVSGIDIVTAGAVAATLDVFINYYQ